MKLLIILCCILQATLVSAQTRFDNQSLNQLLFENQEGIIFAWSPFMPISVVGLQEIIEISESNKIALTILIDPLPMVDHEPTDLLLDSPKLVELGMLNHFPSTVLYKNGTIIPRMIQGHEQKSSLENLILKKLDKQ